MTRRLIRLDNITVDTDLDAFAEEWAKSVASARAEDVSKHAEHDQSTHGRWAEGRSQTEDDDGAPEPRDQTDLLDRNATELANYAVNPRPGVDDNPAIVAQANRLFEQALANEADISPTLEFVATETNGELAGYEWRVKFESSIRDKLARDMASEVAAENNPSWSKVADNIHDLNRYTLTWPADDQWATHHQSALNTLSADGWETFDHKDKNGWSTGDHYNGMNYQFVKGDQFVEIQFHTPESQAIKEASHLVYEHIRLLPPDAPERQEGISAIWDLWNSDVTHVPPGVETIGTPTTYLMKAQVLNPSAASYLFYFRTDDEGEPTILFRTDGITCEAFGNESGAWHPVPLTLPEIAGLGGSSDFYPTSDRGAMDFIMNTDEEVRNIRTKQAPTDPKKVRKHAQGLHEQDDHGNWADRGALQWKPDEDRQRAWIAQVGDKTIEVFEYAEGNIMEKFYWMVYIEGDGEDTVFEKIGSKEEAFAKAEEYVKTLGKGVRKRIIKADFAPTIKVVEADEPQNLVFGWANVSYNADGTQLLDHQGHMVDIEDLEHMAYNFVVKYRKSGDMHSSDAFGELVESMVYTPEKLEVLGLDPSQVPYAWWVGFRLPPEEAAKVRRGERGMFSIEGHARLELAEE